MNVHGYGQHIQTHIKDRKSDEPITTTAVAENLAAAFGIDIISARKITNVNLKRLAEKGILARMRKGVYGKIKETPFGRLAPSKEEVISELLLRDGESAIGYISGPTLLNALGFCSWMTRERHIVTNKYRSRIPEGVPIQTHRPVVQVTDDNMPYLQTLEVLAAMEKYPVDAEKPIEILRGMIQRNKLSNEKLILYAKKHFKQDILIKTIDVTLGGIEL